MQKAGSTEDVPACFSFGIVLFIIAAIWRNNTMEFFNQAITVLQTLVVAIGAGLGVWGVVNLMEGYGNDNPGAKFHGFGEALAEKLHDKINGAAALALAVPVPFVSPDGQAVVPFPAVFIPGAGKLLAL